MKGGTEPVFPGSGTSRNRVRAASPGETPAKPRARPAGDSGPGSGGVAGRITPPPPPREVVPAAPLPEGAGPGASPRAQPIAGRESASARPGGSLRRAGCAAAAGAAILDAEPGFRSPSLPRSRARLRCGESGTLGAEGLCFPPGTAAGMWQSPAPGSEGLDVAGEEKGNGGRVDVGGGVRPEVRPERLRRGAGGGTGRRAARGISGPGSLGAAKLGGGSFLSRGGPPRGADTPRPARRRPSGKGLGLPFPAPRSGVPTPCLPARKDLGKVVSVPPRARRPPGLVLGGPEWGGGAPLAGGSRLVLELKQAAAAALHPAPPCACDGRPCAEPGALSWPSLCSWCS